jgi:hypothetical protein
LVPDYMTSVKDGAFHGWPYSYFRKHLDDRVDPQRPDLVAKAIPPDYALGAHTASLRLTFNTGNQFPPEMAGGAFIGQHGSWNRRPPAGHKVIFVPFANGTPSGPAAGRADRRSTGPAGRGAARQAGRAAGGRRRRQHGVARHVIGQVGGSVAQHRHCERSEAIQNDARRLDCFVADAPRNDG